MNKFFYRLSKWFLDLWRKVLHPRHHTMPLHSCPQPLQPPTVVKGFAFDSSISSKDYGEYLLQSGKWKRNRLRNRY